MSAEGEIGPPPPDRIGPPAQEERREPEEPQPQQQQEEAPPQVIEINPPPPFDSEGLDAVIEEFARLRGLDDKKTAAVKLARVMRNFGVNPDRYAKNVETYINNMSALLSAIPDTPETIPVKGALLGKTALEASQLIRKAHFPEQAEDLELSRDLAAVRRLAITMKLLDNVFTGGSSKSSSEVEMLKRKVEDLEKRNQFQQMLEPLRQQINMIQQQIDKMMSSPPTASGVDRVLTELQNLNQRINQIENKYGLTKDLAEIKERIAQIENRPQPAPVTVPTPQPSNPADQMSQVVDSLTKLYEKLVEFGKKYGKEAGELDWRSVAISTIGEVGSEAIKAFKEAQKSSRTTQTQTTGVDPIIERRVYNYAIKKIQEGEKTLHIPRAAKELGLTPNQVWDALTSIKNKGLLSAQAVSKVAKKTEEPKVEDRTGLSESEIGFDET